MSPATEKPEPRRSIFLFARGQFSLRMLFALMVVVAILLSLFSVPRVRQARAWAALERAGFVSYEASSKWPRSESTGQKLLYEDSTPDLLRFGSGPGCFATVVGVFVYEPSAEFVQELPELHRLEELELYDIPATKELLTTIGGLSKLQQLHLRFDGAEDNALAELKRLSKLHTLRLIGGPLKNADFVGALPELQTLQIHSHRTHRLSEPGPDPLEQIAQSKSLVDIHLRGVPLREQGLTALARMTTLKRLRLDGSSTTLEDWTTISAQDFRVLAQIPNLEWLRIFDAQFAASDLTELRQAPALKSLTLDFRFPLREWPALYELRQLEELKLSVGVRNEDALRQLLRALPRLRALRVVSQIPSSKELLRLRAEFPHCTLDFP